MINGNEVVVRQVIRERLMQAERERHGRTAEAEPPRTSWRSRVTLAIVRTVTRVAASS